MLQTKNNKMVSRIMIMAVLFTGLFFVVSDQAMAQTKCMTAENVKTDDDYLTARDCWLKKVNDGEKDLRGAYLVETFLEKADLNHRLLDGANLSDANLIEANLANVQLTGADLHNAVLRGADLSEAVLNGANLKGAYLNGAKMGGMDLVNADLSGADLRGATWKYAHLNGAKVSRSTKGVDFDDWKSRGGIVLNF